MANVAALNALDPRRRVLALEAAQKIQILCDSLISVSRNTGGFEDILELAAIVRAVAERGTALAYAVIETFDGVSKTPLDDLESEVQNG